MCCRYFTEKRFEDDDIYFCAVFRFDPQYVPRNKTKTLLSVGESQNVLLFQVGVDMLD